MWLASANRSRPWRGLWWSSRGLTEREERRGETEASAWEREKDERREIKGK